MRTGSSIIVRTRPENDDARRLVALLCAIEFFHLFVDTGWQLYRAWLGPHACSFDFHQGSHALIWNTDLPAGLFLAPLVRALTFAGLARALWVKSGAVRYWVVVVACASLAEIACSVPAAGMTLQRLGIDSTASLIWFTFMAAFRHLPWIAVAVAWWILSRPGAGQS